MRRTLRTVGCALLGLAFALSAWVAIRSSDLVEAPDRDLLRPPVATPGGAAAVAALERAAGKLAPADADLARSIAARLEGELGHAEQVDAWLVANRAALEQARAAIATGALAFAPLERVDDRVPDLLAWVLLAKGLVLDPARVSRERASWSRLEAALDVVEFGRLVQRADHGVLLHMMVGLSIETIGLQGVRRTLPEVELSPRDGLRISDRLVDARGPDAWERMWAAEYRTMKGTLEHAWAAQPEDELRTPPAEGAEWAYAALPRDRAELLRLLADRNPLGRILLRVATPGFWRFHHRRCHIETEREATRALVGLHAYRARTGSLPETLESLVPGYVTSLPRDGFDLGPLRFAPGERRLWAPERDAPECRERSWDLDS